MRPKITLRRVLLTIAAFVVVCLSFVTASSLGNLGAHRPITYLLYACTVHAAVWTLLLPLLAACVRRWPLDDKYRLRNGSVLLLVTAAIAPLAAACIWTIICVSHLTASSIFEFFLQKDFVRFLYGQLITCIALILALQAFRTWRRYELERDRARELEARLAVAELNTLRMQVHPHFLFNTLHTIAGLINHEPATARRMVVALGDFLRQTLKGRASVSQSLAQEIEFADLYLGIEKLRLGNRLDIRYDMDSEAAAAEVPHLLLQPLFENAVRHGAARISRPCRIEFAAHRDGDMLLLRIENDGPVRTMLTAPLLEGVGLRNTKGRLRLLYEDRFAFQYADRPEGGVRIDLTLPYQRVVREESHDLESARAHAYR